MEPNKIENDIVEKARELVDEYGAEFLVELIGDFLDDAVVRLVRLRESLAAGDAESLTHEAHTLKSSSASLGALTLSAMAKQLESAGREGEIASLAVDLARFEEQFALVKADLEKLRNAPEEFIAQER
jgi:HPt (histidine-containing phosphotransfer) domain-containing protein